VLWERKRLKRKGEVEAQRNLEALAILKHVIPSNFGMFSGAS
jgi:hypothetical protein